MEKNEILKYAEECLGLSENDLKKGIEHYHKTGQVLNRAVALSVGLTED